MDGLLALGKNRTIDIFQKHGANITKLFLFHTHLDRMDLFLEMLKCLPNLEHLILYKTETDSQHFELPPEDDLPELMKLKTLEMVESEYRIVKCFKRSQLQAFKLLSLAYAKPLENPEPILDLLTSQHQLTTLALRNVDHVTSKLFQDEITDGSVKFELSQLSLLNIKLRESPNDYDNLLNFLKPQANTINALELGRIFPDSVYEFVFAKLKNLKSLRLLINQLPKDMAFYEKLEENESITKLILMDSPPPNHLNNGCPSSLKEFIRHVPNVTDLTLLEYCDRGTIQYIANNLKQLRKLDVNYFCESIFGGLQFSKLTSLHIQKVDDDVNWDQFTKTNPGITELVIHTGTFAGFSDWTAGTINDFVEKTTRNLRLETLRIGSRFCTNEHFYEILRKNCSELKFIDLHKACAAAEDRIMEGIPGLRFHDDNLVASLNEQEIWIDDDYDGHLPQIDKGSGNWDTNFVDPFVHVMDIDEYAHFGAVCNGQNFDEDFVSSDYDDSDDLDEDEY